MLTSRVSLNFCLIIIIILTFSKIPISGAKTSVLCPEPLRGIVEKFGCDRIKCQSSFTAANCTVGTVYEEKLTFCGCCPGCAKYIGFALTDMSSNPDYICNRTFDGSDLKYDDCDSLYCPVLKNCKPGLICNDKNLCELPPEPYPTCQGRCWLQRAVSEAPDANWKWKPACTADGYYEPLQMKGQKNTGDCYCVDECGERIMGRSRWLNENNECRNQTCACSRHVHRLRKQEGRIATIHCDQQGNYEPFQCDTDSSLCYCVDPQSGRVMGDVLPKHLWKSLPCYDPKVFLDNDYYRICESEWAPGQQLSTEAKLHGLNFGIGTLDCDYDGSHKPLFQSQADYRERCVHKNGIQILNYQRQYRGTKDMNCRCARDIGFFASLGIKFTRACQDETGNYDNFYFTGDTASCVDFDGYQYGPIVPAGSACCLELADGAHTCQDPEAASNCTRFYPPCHTYVFARDN